MNKIVNNYIDNRSNTNFNIINNNQKRVIVFGAGIAGLSAAHYLNQRGYNVIVIEKLPIPGGLARSERYATGLPTEYSYRGFGAWYKNTFSVMKEIKTEWNKTVYDELKPIESFDFIGNEEKYKFGPLDMMRMGWLALKTWSASDIRSRTEYAKQKASDQFNKTLSARGAHVASQVLGPWVGSDSGKVSMHQTGLFFRRNLFPGPPSPYYHPQTDKHEEFWQGNADKWLICVEPINEIWFNPWVKQLQSQGVEFRFNEELYKFVILDNKIIGANIHTNDNNYFIQADYYVLATNPYITNDILNRTPILLEDSQLGLFPELVNDPGHRQISFRIIFPEKIVIPKDMAIILVDSEYDITFYSQTFFEDLGQGVKSLWSGTTTVDSVPGKLFGLPYKAVTKEQFIEEVRYQFLKSKGLDKIIKENNNGRSLSTFPMEIEVWPTWIFPPKVPLVSDPEQPKWVNNTRNQPYLPSARTSYPEIYIAGAHTKTNTDLYSMEAAVESGRKAADLISNMNTVIPQHVPLLLKPFRFVDHILYTLGLPHIVYVLIIVLVVLLTARKMKLNSFNTISIMVILIIILTLVYHLSNHIN